MNRIKYQLRAQCFIVLFALLNILVSALTVVTLGFVCFNPVSSETVWNVIGEYH